MNKELNLKKAKRANRIGKPIGDAVKERIKAIGKNQSEVGQISRLGRAEISRIIKGMYEPRLSTIVKVMEATEAKVLTVTIQATGEIKTEMR